MRLSKVEIAVLIIVIGGIYALGYMYRHLPITESPRDLYDMETKDKGMSDELKAIFGKHDA